MKYLQEIWNKTGQAITAFSPVYQEHTVRLTQKYDAPIYWFILNWVRANEPEPLVLESMLDIIEPYTKEETTIERFDEFVESGFLTKDEGGGLTLTDSGRGLIEGFFSGAHDAMASLEPLPQDEMFELQKLLKRLVNPP